MPPRQHSITLFAFAAALLLTFLPKTPAATNGPVLWGTQKFDSHASDQPLTKIAAGGDHTLAVKNDGTVVAWGRNTYFQTHAPAGLNGVIAIVAGEDHALALKNDGTVVARGDDRSNQATVPAGLNGVNAIAAGYYHTVALKSDGPVVAWGRAFEGQTTVPTGLSGVTKIAAGFAFTVALLPITYDPADLDNDTLLDTWELTYSTSLAARDAVPRPPPAFLKQETFTWKTNAAEGGGTKEEGTLAIIVCSIFELDS